MAFHTLKSQNFEIIFKMKVKNRTVFYFVLSFHISLIKVQVARAFAVFVGKLSALTKIYLEFLQPQLEV